MGRGITIRVDRAEAIRLIGKLMRDKRAEFVKEKANFPKKVETVRQQIVNRLLERQRAVRKEKTGEKLSTLASRELFDWAERKEWGIEKLPQLNLCVEKRLLLMLQQDVRPIIPVNSNHELWAVLQGQCEPIE